MYPVIYTLGAKALGGMPQWEAYLKDWAADVAQKEAEAEFMRNRFNPQWRPTVEQVPDQAELMGMMGGPAPLRQPKTEGGE